VGVARWPSEIEIETGADYLVDRRWNTSVCHPLGMSWGNKNLLSDAEDAALATCHKTRTTWGSPKKRGPKWGKGES